MQYLRLFTKLQSINIQFDANFLFKHSLQDRSLWTLEIFFYFPSMTRLERKNNFWPVVGQYLPQCNDGRPFTASSNNLVTPFYDSTQVNFDIYFKLLEYLIVHQVSVHYGCKHGRRTFIFFTCSFSFGSRYLLTSVIFLHNHEPMVVGKFKFF